MFWRRIIRLNCLPSSRICLGNTSEKFMVSVENLQVCRTLSNIYKRALFVKILNSFQLLFSKKKLRRRCLTGLKIEVWLRVWNIELILFKVYKFSQENTQRENICDVIFEKTKGRGWIVSRMSVYVEPAVQRVL